jgi:hypothetical protein
LERRTGAGESGTALFHFGSGPHSDTENLGYFVDSEGTIETYLPGGKRVGTWRSLGEFQDELARLEALDPESERKT